MQNTTTRGRRATRRAEGHTPRLTLIRGDGSRRPAATSVAAPPPSARADDLCGGEVVYAATVAVPALGMSAGDRLVVHRDGTGALVRQLGPIAHLLLWHAGLERRA
jgi:hypothetical protein